MLHELAILFHQRFVLQSGQYSLQNPELVLRSKDFDQCFGVNLKQENYKVKTHEWYSRKISSEIISVPEDEAVTEFYIKTIYFITIIILLLFIYPKRI